MNVLIIVLLIVNFYKEQYGYCNIIIRFLMYNKTNYINDHELLWISVYTTELILC